jgi:phage terminase small subunit
MSMQEVQAARKKNRPQKYAAAPLVGAIIESELGPAMLACTEKQRRFVLELQHGPAGYGSEIRAAKAAGYKAGSDGAFSVIAHNTLHHPRVQEALREVGYRMIRAASFKAIRNVEDIANDPKHPDRLKANLALMDRGGFAVETHHTVTVKHQTLDDEAIEALKTMRTIGATQEQLVAFFGESGLARYETMLAEKAKLIEGKAA